jgi:hypothetical protein
MNLNFTPAENELLLTEQAVVRKGQSRLGAGVVLLPSQRTLCSCDDELHASLIAKLFNQGPGVAA